MNKVNMSLDDIIKKSKHGKRNSNVTRGGKGGRFRKTDGQTRGRKRFDQVEGGRKNSFNINENSLRRRGGFRRYNNFNKNENSNGRGGIKVGI
jgi:hypothetical protein